MNRIVEQMLEKYDISSKHNIQRALREVLQEIVLVGVWRAKLFEHMAFYGGTALRILYGLDRFSEDIDFSLLKPNPDFKWHPFAKTIENELRSFGFDFTLEQKKKSFSSEVQSAFLKTNTLQAMLKVGVDKNFTLGLHPDTILKIKIEVDTDPVLGFRTQQQIVRNPVPIPITTIVKPDLFASKMHAALYRAWKNRVKGRDWYDVVWYIRNKVPIGLDHFNQCLKKNFPAKQDLPLNLEDLKELILNKINTLDIQSAKKDILPFVRDKESIEIWDKEYLKHWIDQLKVEA
jgi:predicted nucleotidyltransferase component of viral defense system